MKQMAAEMQQELETTRAELRRGIFELPQETAESAAQMRRVIVDQIEALAELNRIVARHGRSLDSTDPTQPARREPEPAYTNRRRAPQPRPARPRCAGPPAAAAARRYHRRAAPAGGAAAPPRRERPQQQRRLAERPADARLARGQPADRAARRVAATTDRATTSSRWSRSRSTSPA